MFIDPTSIMNDFIMRNIGQLNLQLEEEVLLYCGRCKYGVSGRFGRFVSLKVSTVEAIMS